MMMSVHACAGSRCGKTVVFLVSADCASYDQFVVSRIADSQCMSPAAPPAPHHIQMQIGRASRSRKLLLSCNRCNPATHCPCNSTLPTPQVGPHCTMLPYQQHDACIVFFPAASGSDLLSPACNAALLHRQTVRKDSSPGRNTAAQTHDVGRAPVA